LRASHTPVPGISLVDVSADPEQALRALTSLLADGLAVRVGADHVGLPN